MQREQVFSSFSDQFKGRQGHKKFRSIAIVTRDIKEPNSSGGVATANSAIAECLSSFGHKVTIIFVSRDHSKANDFHLLQLYYAEKGIELLWLPEPEFRLESLDPARLSYASYLYLKSKNFEIIHFSDYLGLAYYSLMAKSVGTDFQKTLICVTLHGPSHWGKLGNLEFSSSPEDLLYFYLERKSVELADVLISATQYFANWAVMQKWKLPKKTFVQPLPLTIDTPFSYLGDRKRFKELVFFGRLETRKGIIEFCDALDKLPANALSELGITVVFLGSPGSAKWCDSHAYISERARNWSFAWKVILDFNQERALHHLATSQALVVLPSRDESMGYTVLECIKIGAPFLAADIAPFREIIRAQDHKKVLCEARSDIFSARILQALRHGAFTARPSVNFAKNHSTWGEWHSSIEISSVLKKSALKKPPLVSVCLTHRNRPQFLEQSLSSLMFQDYPNFEVIIMDDASDTKSSEIYLKSLGRRLNHLGWKLNIMPSPVGPSALRNKAAKLARGKYILFMDDDNIAKTYEISTFVKAAQSSSSDILTCTYDRFRGSEMPCDKPINRVLPLGDIQSLNLMVNLLGDMNFFVKRSAFLALGGLSHQEKNIGAEDAEFLARAALAGLKLSVVPDALFWYRLHDANFTLQVDEMGTLIKRIDPYLKIFDNLDMKQLMNYSVGVWYKFFQSQIIQNNQLFPELGYRIYDPVSFFKNRRLFFVDKDSFKNNLLLAGQLKIQKDADQVLVSGSGVMIPIELKLESLQQIYVRLNCTSLGLGKVWLSLGTKMGKSFETQKKDIHIGPNQVFIFVNLITASANFDYYTGLPVFNSLKLYIEQLNGSVIAFQSLQVFGLS